jgi:hypothetical protein
MSDNYEYMKSCETQNIDDYAPYVDKQHNNYVNSTYYNGSCLECKKCWVLDPHHFCSIRTNFFILFIKQTFKSMEKLLNLLTQPFINVARHFQLFSEMSVNALATIGHSLGFEEKLKTL